MSGLLRALLTRQGIVPHLVDIGASIGPPAVWKPIAENSVYVGFDPDERDTRQLPDSEYSRAFVVNQAVVPAETSTAHFYLTRSPYCSSTLRPLGESLADYAFADLFDVEREVDVPAATIDQALARLGLDRVDWFKTDSQGTDLRLFQSLSPAVRTGVLVVDVEPGLIDAYAGEDLFVETHRALTQEGFWLSRAEVQGTARMMRGNARRVEAMLSLTPERLMASMRPSPGWVEARYVRRLDSIPREDLRSAVLLWVFAMLDGQFGFATDVAAMLKQFGQDALGDELAAAAVDAIARGARAQSRRDGARTAGRMLRRLARKP